MTRRYAGEQFILNLAAADGAGVERYVPDLMHNFFTLSCDADADMVVKFAGSYADLEDAPDFDSAPSETNRWDYIDVRDMEDNSQVDGDTGITLSGADVRQFEANSNGLKFICAIISSYSGGHASVRHQGFSNE